MDDFASFKPKGKTNEEWVKEAQGVIDAHRGKGEGDILKEIFARAEQGKRDGTLTNAQIDAFYAQFAPMLDAPKRKRLKKLVEQLKSM